MTICKLCQEDKKLIKKSHIIPDFLYKKIYDEKHKLISFTPSEYQEDKKVKTPSSSEYEGQLLCEECDNKLIGQYESYADKTIYGGNFGKTKAPDCQKLRSQDLLLLQCKNLDYTKLKLFFLSILWRASISSRPMFSEVNLGDKYTKRIQNMLIEGDASNDTDIAIVALTWSLDNKAPRDLVISPRLSKSGGKFMYLFPISGFLYFFYVSPDSCHKDFQDYRLKEDGAITFIEIPKGYFWKFVFNYTGVSK